MAKQIIRQTIITTLFIFCAFFAMTTACAAATLTVTSTGDTTVGADGCSDGCSLREAIETAAADDTINFNPATFSTPQTINLTSPGTSSYFRILKNLTINGPGARLLTVRRGIPDIYDSGLFTVGVGVSVTISGLTVANGDSDANGGSISNNATLTLIGVTVTGDRQILSAISNAGIAMTMINCTVSNNTGIGINSQSGTLDIANSTISGNSGAVTGTAGGILHSSTSRLNLNNVTVTANTNGGIQKTVAGAGAVNLRNTIVSGNTGIDMRGAFVSLGNNVIGTTTGRSVSELTDLVTVDANLGPLADNGGQTDTHRPNAGSPAIDAGDNCVLTLTCATNNPPVALTTDQRGAGFLRNGNSTVDIGAFEVLAPTAARLAIAGRVTTAKGRGIANAVVTIYGGHLTAPLTMRTKALGYYRFDDLEAGQTYVLEVRGRRYAFSNSTRIVNPAAELTEENFIAER